MPTLLIADCWLALCLFTEVPGLLPDWPVLLPVVLCTRWIAARSLALTGFTDDPLMV